MASSSGNQASALRYAVGEAKTEERVRGLIALILVGVLIALVFNTPAEPAAVVASAKTLAISVIAFYFGLHKGTPQGQTAVERDADAKAASNDPPAAGGGAHEPQ